MSKTKIKTERLTLRKPEMSDAKAVYEMHKDDDVTNFTHIPYPYKLEDAKEYLKKEIEKFGKESYGFLIFLNDTEEIVGSLGIMNLNKKDNRAEIGYYIGKKYRNKGYVTEACRELLDFGFNKINLNRININHVKGNGASKRVIKKIGAKKEGLEREGIKTADGEYKDHLLYAILAKDWEKIK